jgi:hypothetical protein
MMGKGGGVEKGEEGVADGGARTVAMGDEVERPGQFQAGDGNGGELAALDVAGDGELRDDGYLSRPPLGYGRLSVHRAF